MASVENLSQRLGEFLRGFPREIHKWGKFAEEVRVLRGPKFTADPLSAQDPKLAESVRRLVDAFHPVRIYLFGSGARGERHPNSDYDLLVLVKESSEPLYRLSQRAYSSLWDLGVATDILIWPEDLFARRAHLKASLPGTVLREGRLLYEA